MDPKAFLRQMKAGSRFEVILRGHIAAEAALIAVIEQFVKLPQHLDIDRVSFPGKVSLATSMGLVAPEERSALLELNRLRNALAHDLSAEPDDLQINRLCGSLRGRPRIAWDAALGGGHNLSLDDILRFAIICMVMSLDAARAHLAYERENWRGLLQHAAQEAAREIEREMGVTTPLRLPKLEPLPPRPDPTARWSSREPEAKSDGE